MMIYFSCMWNGDASQMMFNKQKQCQLPVYQPSFIHHVSIQCIYIYVHCKYVYIYIDILDIYNIDFCRISQIFASSLFSMPRAPCVPRSSWCCPRTAASGPPACAVRHPGGPWWSAAASCRSSFGTRKT